jgi:hypothetical protein
MRQAMLSKDRRENISFWVLSGFLVFCAVMIVRESYWRMSEGPGITEIPKPQESLATFFMMVFFTAQMVIGVSAVLQRVISLWWMVVFTILTLPTVFLFKIMVSTVGTGALAVQIDEFARVILGGCAGILLIMPWIFRRMRWPARSPGHLAIGIGISSMVALQFVFHFALVIPASELSFAKADQMKSLIERTESSRELQRLWELGAVSLDPLEGENIKKTLIEAGVIDAVTVARSVLDIAIEAPDALHVWSVAGESRIDRNLIIYDGRGDEPAAYVAGTRNFMLARLTGISALYFLSAFSSVVWMVGALVVHAAHGKRRWVR